VIVQRLKQAIPGQLGMLTRPWPRPGVNIEVMYSDHDHQLILSWTMSHAAGPSSAAWTREMGHLTLIKCYEVAHMLKRIRHPRSAALRRPGSVPVAAFVSRDSLPPRGSSGGPGRPKKRPTIWLSRTAFRRRRHAEDRARSDAEIEPRHQERA
jgi:hypothetical protein